MSCYNEKANEIFYNKTAINYKSTVRINQEGNKKRIRAILSKIIHNNNVKILDACCGAGLYLSILKDLTKDGNLTGLDISSEMLKIASKFCKNLKLGSVYKLPFDDNSFDLVTCSSALHHLDNLEGAISEIYRVLSPSGVFVSDYDNNLHFAKIHNIMKKLLKTLLVYPLLVKLFKPKHPSQTKAEKKNLEDMPIEELHKIAEAQNYYHDGVNSSLLRDILKKTGFKKIELFVYNSHKWNKGVRFNLRNSVFNNKIYSISTK